MKFSKLTATTAAVAATIVLSACSSDGANTSSSASSSAASATQSANVPSALPTVEELNAILALASDPAAPIEEKTQTVQGGESAPELFEVMTHSKIESGANFQVVQPILPGYTADSVLATVNFILPDREAQPAENVEFIFENGRWKLSQSWACTLITNTVAPEQVPPMCHAALGNEVPPPADAPPADAPPADAPPAEAPPAEAPPADAPTQ
ncbi:hypothetical protein P4N68_07575 [Corynebacterium felinum]|uniref:Low molecular weight antigen MTB12-like C-terminal domain-containing protein n=1 Tax=Corynebacterium felinum TaxID=131318 RepID=A0ABU2BFH1_9CORY|nr:MULTISPECIES: hypothetical protein [Corynebacterium]MDF5820936.1 hypothetical protein [Corynebacterium felinum]MDO4761422.1 hypothetical protein [Corynebacterium sp.]MDR7356119.1 hypothetical protein [Corynebacterium felinum]WJY95453.1 hypothetical protein CFELI_09245 [Corynebacterium felinum]